MGRLFFFQKDLGLLLTQMVCILEKGYKKASKEMEKRAFVK